MLCVICYLSKKHLGMLEKYASDFQSVILEHGNEYIEKRSWYFQSVILGHSNKYLDENAFLNNTKIIVKILIENDIHLSNRAVHTCLKIFFDNSHCDTIFELLVTNGYSDIVREMSYKNKCIFYSFDTAYNKITLITKYTDIDTANNFVKKSIFDFDVNMESIQKLFDIGINQNCILMALVRSKTIETIDRLLNTVCKDINFNQELIDFLNTNYVDTSIIKLFEEHGFVPCFLNEDKF
jgi:hypothetical protein